MCLSNYQAERLKEQASCWEKEEREAYMCHGSRQPLTKVHCKVPYRTYKRRPAMSWSRHVQRSPEVSEDADDDDDDDDEDDSDASDGSPPILTKAHAMLATKRKVTTPTGIVSLMIRRLILGCRPILSVIRDCAVCTGETERLDKYA